MSQEKPAVKKTTDVVDVFIITPIGANGSETFIKANGLIDSVINPVLNKVGMRGTAAHQIDASGSINNQIIDRIVNDKLVIANLTGLNPNVMYELAIRHAARKPVIMMADKGVTDRLPFDIQDQRTIFYDDTLAGSVIARLDLEKKINAINYDEKPDNPIYSAIKLNTILENVEAGDINSILLERIDRLSIQVNKISTVEKTHYNDILPNNTERFTIELNKTPTQNDLKFIKNQIITLTRLHNGEIIEFMANIESKNIELVALIPPKPAQILESSLTSIENVKTVTLLPF